MFFYIAATQPDRGWTIVPHRWPVWVRGLAGYAAATAVFYGLAWVLRDDLSEVPSRFGIWFALMAVVDVVWGVAAWRRRHEDRAGS